MRYGSGLRQCLRGLGVTRTFGPGHNSRRSILDVCACGPRALQRRHCRAPQGAKGQTSGLVRVHERLQALRRSPRLRGAGSKWARYHARCGCGQDWVTAHAELAGFTVVRKGGFVALVGPGLTEGVDEGKLTTNAVWQAVTGTPRRQDWSETVHVFERRAHQEGGAPEKIWRRPRPLLIEPQDATETPRRSGSRSRKRSSITCESWSRT